MGQIPHNGGWLARGKKKKQKTKKLPAGRSNPHTKEQTMTVPNYEAFSALLQGFTEQGYMAMECTQHKFNGIKKALATLRKRNVSLFAIQLRCEDLQPEEQYVAPTGGLVCFRVWIEKKKEGESARGETARQMRSVGLEVDAQIRPQERHLVDEAERIQREYRRYAEWCSAHPGATDEDKIAAGWAEQVREDREFERMVGQKKTGTGEEEKGEKGSQDFFEQKFGF